MVRIQFYFGVAGGPVPKGTAANKAVAVKRAKYGNTHILTEGFYVFALERFGFLHPDAIRFAKRIGHLAARRQALAHDEAAAVHDPMGVAQRGVASAVASQTLASVSIALQRSNAMTLRTYQTDCLHHTNTSVPAPFGHRRRWTPPAKAGAVGGAGEGGAVLGDVGVEA